MEPMLIDAEELAHDAGEALVIRAWRVEQLGRLGVPYILADRFADVIDWHALAELIERGCPLHLALDIVR